MMDGVVDDAVTTDYSSAWEELYRSHYPKAVRLAGLLLGDYQEGEEIAQDAFARLLEVRTGVTNPAAYLRGIVVNLCRSRVRRAVLSRRHRLWGADDLPGPEESGDQLAARSEVRQALPATGARASATESKPGAEAGLSVRLFSVPPPPR